MFGAWQFHGDTDNNTSLNYLLYTPWMDKDILVGKKNIYCKKNGMDE